MNTFLFLSVVFATVTIPMFLARDPNAHRALGRTLMAMVLFNVAYFFLVLVVYPRISSAGG